MRNKLFNTPDLTPKKKKKKAEPHKHGYKAITSSDKPKLYEAFQQTLSMPPKNNNNKNWDIDALPKSSTFDPNHSQKLSNQIKSNKN